MIVADTDAISFALKGVPPWAERVRDEFAHRSLAITTITAFELARWKRGRRRARAFLEEVPAVLGLDLTAALHAAELKEFLEAVGRTIATPDALIAGVCVANHVPLLTGNVRHFERVPGLELVPLE